MEAIAEINDLACHSIEVGDYQIALDVLNSCLGCVKQLKKFRAPSSESSTKGAERRRTATKETIERTLKVGKQKLLDRLRTVTNTNFAVANKRKEYSSSITVTRPRKRRRQRSQNDLTIALPSSDVSTSSIDSPPVAPSRQSSYSFPITPSCPESVAASSSNSCSSSCQRLLTEHFSCQHQDTEERYFVYRKPIQLSKFQWSRIAECQNKEGRDAEQQQQIHREVELAVSANLIFNIALSHHLIASSTKSELAAARNRRLSLSPDSGDDDTDDEEDDDNGCGYGSLSSNEMSVADSLQTKQRLKGALRLYELGFRVHTKRVAFVMSAKTQSSRREYLYNSSSSILSASSSLSSTASPLSPDEPRARRSASSQDRRNDRDDELKSTTRFALALLNNCAHIHNVLGQTEKAKVFQKRLLSFLLVIVDSGESIHDIIGDDPAVDGYLKNVFAATVFDKKTAPAAMA